VGRKKPVELPANLADYTHRQIAALSQTRFMALSSELLRKQQAKRQNQQILYYQPVTDEAMKVHLATERYVGVGGGNGSSKTETCLVDLIADATGIVPYSLRDVGIDWKKRFRGPTTNRIIVESLTTTLENIILPKLQWWVWTGIDQPGGARGHWGWIPRSSLISGSWEKSYSQKLRTLRVYCRDPEEPTKIIGESTIQFMAHNQDATDFASGDFDRVLFDEPSRYAIFRENEARTMRVNGRIFLAMTWPDDPEIPMDWLFDEFYDKAQPGEGKHKNYSWINLYTTDNPHLNQESVSEQAESWSEQTKLVRIYGQPIRFSKRVHPLFTDQDQWWCFSCQKVIAPVDGHCRCGGENIALFNHVAEFDHSGSWPVVFLLDPHPRKPHMGAWIQVTPNDDYDQIDEILCDESAEELAREVYEREAELDIHVVMRFMDPNMGASPANARERETTWQDEFDRAGLGMALADDSGVGRKRINAMLKPDRDTMRPRFRIHRRCSKAVHQFKRFVWDDYRLNLEKDQKQVPKNKDDDFPALWRYFANEEVTFQQANFGAPIMRHGKETTAASRVRRSVG
jgi:hypothetical protein